MVEIFSAVDLYSLDECLFPAQIIALKVTLKWICQASVLACIAKNGSNKHSFHSLSDRQCDIYFKKPWRRKTTVRGLQRPHQLKQRRPYEMQCDWTTSKIGIQTVPVLWNNILYIGSYRWLDNLNILVVNIPRFCHVVGCKMHQISLTARLGIVTITSRGVWSGWTPSKSPAMLKCQALFPQSSELAWLIHACIVRGVFAPGNLPARQCQSAHVLRTQSCSNERYSAKMVNSVQKTLPKNK